ncbi:HIP1R protein, partial [Polypterus senegalus]
MNNLTMNTIKQVPARVLSRRSGNSLEAEREHFDRQQSHMHDRYGQLVSLYTNLLTTKMNFHRKHTDFPSNLEVSDDGLEKAAGTDVNNIFQLTVEMFDYLGCELKLAESVFRQLNTSVAVSQTAAGQCRLAPLIQVIQDCSNLYHYIVKLLFKLHSCLPADTLQGHRDRFHDQFHSLKNFFNRARDLLYFKRLIQIPKLPESPPNFLRASALAEHVKPVVVIPDEEAPEEDEPESLIEVSTAHQTEQQNIVDIFDQTFGPPNGFVQDDRDIQIENLKKEVELLRAELERIKSEAQRYITQLKAQINTLEAELEDQRKQKQKALVDNEQLRIELENLRQQKLETENAQGQLAEAERKAQATELRYNKLKEKHSQLVNNHAELLRKNADTAKMLTVTQQTQEDVARTKQQLVFEMEQIKQESEMKSGEMLNKTLQTLQVEKDTLSKTLSERDVELSCLKDTIQQKEVSLQQERERGCRERDQLQGKLKDKSMKEELLQQRLLDEQFKLLQQTVKEAENIIQDAVTRLDDPLHIRCTSSPDYLVSRAEATLESITSVQQGHVEYLKNEAGLTENCRDCAKNCLEFLSDLKTKQSLKHANPSAVKAAVQNILQLGQELRPKNLDIRQEELGDMVDKEMAATSAAIEDAVRRIEGAATPKEFYAKNSRWTEGLISASKAVGWGATQMVESADKVVLHTGKYEELIVCSHEIAASTAQLVAASKVKADKNSNNLSRLQQASRHVNEMAANVVASTKSGQEQIEDKDTMDFSGMSLIKLRKEEMESQVKVLELESKLENERMRLGELRKKHYELAGGIEDTPTVEQPIKTASSASVSMRPGSLKKPPVAQKPTVPPKSNNPVTCLYAGTLMTLSPHAYDGHFSKTSSNVGLVKHNMSALCTAAL